MASGEAFIKSVAELQFKTSSSMFPYLRSALLATNICCPPEKIEDGYARLLKDTDVATMEAKDKLIQVTSVEKVLMES